MTGSTTQILVYIIDQWTVAVLTVFLHNRIIHDSGRKL